MTNYGFWCFYNPINIEVFLKENRANINFLNNKVTLRQDLEDILLKKCSLKKTKSVLNSMAMHHLNFD